MLKISQSPEGIVLSVTTLRRFSNIYSVIRFTLGLSIQAIVVGASHVFYTHKRARAQAPARSRAPHTCSSPQLCNATRAPLQSGDGCAVTMVTEMEQERERERERESRENEKNIVEWMRRDSS